ncbi:hypothetical protein [uncultured Dechloromonas sp.]|uniref:hypothetical protein n=1 Tax=uncultured Dechloromonas sp. TaxID=171719 RepID=UPI0025D77986|nr:hypothetical protein [uncultured Dechloromonas sp.]
MSQSDETRKRLFLVLKQLQRDASKAEVAGSKPPRISISAVAKAAGVSHTLIHTKYPDVAERIRAAVGSTLLIQRQKKHTALVTAKGRIAELRKDLESLRAENRGLASENSRLTLLVLNLQSEIMVAKANVPIIGQGLKP